MHLSSPPYVPHVLPISVIVFMLLLNEVSNSEYMASNKARMVNKKVEMMSKEVVVA
jgi:hypothetical protein